MPPDSCHFGSDTSAVVYDDHAELAAIVVLFEQQSSEHEITGDKRHLRKPNVFVYVCNKQNKQNNKIMFKKVNVVVADDRALFLVRCWLAFELPFRADQLKVQSNQTNGR